MDLTERRGSGGDGEVTIRAGYGKLRRVVDDARLNDREDVSVGREAGGWSPGVGVCGSRCIDQPHSRQAVKDTMWALQTSSI